MDNKRLDQILKQKFQSLQDTGTQPTLVPDIMAQVAALPDVALEQTPVKDGIGSHWIVLLGALIGGTIFALSLQALPAELLTALLPLTLLGGYAHTFTALLVPLVATAALTPVAWLMLEDCPNSLDRAGLTFKQDEIAAHLAAERD